MSIKRFAISIVSLLIIGGFAKAQSATATATGPAVKPDAVQKKAGTAPPTTATKTKTAGKSATKLSTANSPTDDDSFWIEKLDIDGDGNVDDANLVWDDEDKVLFAWKDARSPARRGAPDPASSSSPSTPRATPATVRRARASGSRRSTRASATRRPRASGAASWTRRATRRPAGSRPSTRRMTTLLLRSSRNSGEHRN
jgi:hypothetical protein